MSKDISKRFPLIFSFFIIMLLSTNLFAWDSLGPFTHEQIAVDAVSLLPTADYPDIDRFSTNLIDYSKNEIFSHDWNPLANGGSPVTLWDKKVLPQYNKGDYGDAYDYVGCILHLVQDQGVPAHAFDIQHVRYWAWYRAWTGDQLEKYSNRATNDGSYYSPGPISIQPGNDPLAFYGNMNGRTLGVINSNLVAPPAGETWSDYWQPDSFGPSEFPRSRDDVWYVIEHDNLVQHRITESINYVAGNMAAASKSLRPLLKNLDIAPSTNISPQINLNGTDISFDIMENRKQTVNVFITVDSEAGPAIQDIHGNVYNGLPVALDSTIDNSKLPWEKINHIVSWGGILYDGYSYPTDGPHTLFVKIVDQDGNVSTISTHLFTIYTHPVLTISKTGSGTVQSTLTGIDCGNDCSEIYNHSDTVTLTATPDAEWTFDVNGWTGCDSVSGNTCDVMMNGDRTVTAVFTAINEWAIETVDYSGNVGWSTSIAIDSSGKAHIIYYDNGNLTYVTNASGVWGVPETLASVGIYSSIAVDSLGSVHISYDDRTTYDLKYVTNASGTWVHATVDSVGSVGRYSSIAVDSSDNVHISYYENITDNLKYATNTYGSWFIQTVDSNGDVGSHTSIALDSSDNVHISYSDWDNYDLKYATNASGVWGVPVTVDSAGNVGEYTSIAMDSLDKVHISYYDWTNYDLKYATNASGSWIPVTLDYSGNVGRSTAIAIDLSGNVHISYVDLTNGYLKHAATNAVVNKYTLIASKTGSGSGSIQSLPEIDCGGKCRESYDQGTVVTLAAIPDVNSTFNGWSGGGCSGAGQCDVTISGDVTVTANFTSIMSTITAVFNSSRGVISPATALVTYGEDQTFSIIPNTGYHITDVLIDGSTSAGAVPAYTFFNVTSAHTIEGSFVTDTYYLAVAAGPGGSINPGSMTVNYETSRTFFITPDTDYHITDVLVDGLSVGTVTSWPFSNIVADHMIEATFEPDCTPVASDDTTCDGIDDDCDGTEDEDYVITSTNCGIGACSETGQLECQNGSVVDTCTEGTPAVDDSVCNGIDDDCDGPVDEDYIITPTACGLGVCASTGQLECQSGIEVDVCIPGTPQTEGPYNDPTCSDLADNDCDGDVDDADSECFVDSDGDGILDSIDNCYLTPNPGQQDSDSDGYGNICDADLDNNDNVGISDFNIFKLSWFATEGSPNYNADADFDSNGNVGISDFNIFKARWFTNAPWH